MNQMQVSHFRHLFPLILVALAAAAAGCGKNPPAPAPVAGSYDFSLPRQAWNHLDEKTRARIDAGLAGREKPAISILHSTGSASASAAAIADNHRRIRGLTDGMAYHFLIGNGLGIGDGTVVVGPRWDAGQTGRAMSDPTQDSGAVAIALVGNFNRTDPTRAQLEALDELLDYLTGRIGPHPVRLHREVENSPRGCPGKRFPVEALRQAYSL